MRRLGFVDPLAATVLLRHRLESAFIPQGTEPKPAKDYRNSEEIFAGGGLV
jgi:hypothetical protein